MELSDNQIQFALKECYRKASESCDTSTQIGAVYFNKWGLAEWNTLSNNSETKGWKLDPSDLERPRKYSIIEHAERNCIYAAAKFGYETDGAAMIGSWAACVECARAIVQSGFSTLIRHQPPMDPSFDRWMDSIRLGDELMLAAGVKLVNVTGPIEGAPKILRDGILFDPSSPDYNWE